VQFLNFLFNGVPVCYSFFVPYEFMFKVIFGVERTTRTPRPGIKICWWQVEEKNQFSGKAASSKAFQSLFNPSTDPPLQSVNSEIFHFSYTGESLVKFLINS
jgi:hypothetical protein